MNEDRIRSALRAEAQGAEATEAKWDGVRRRARVVGRTRRTQRFLVAGLSAAAVIAVVVGIFVAIEDGDDRGLIAPEPTQEPSGPNGAPPFVVTVAASGAIQIRETGSGEVVRRLDASSDPDFGVPRLAASPDGRYVFFDRVVSDGACADEARELLRYDVVSSASVVIVEGIKFSVSPDGTQVAYVTGDVTAESCLTGAEPASERAELVVRKMEGSGERRWGSVADSYLNDLSWSPDSRKVSFTLTDVSDPSRRESFRVIDPDDAATSNIQEAEEIAVPDATRPLGFLTGDEYLGTSEPEDGTQVIGFDREGQGVRVLGTLRGVAEVLGAAPSRDGKHVLVVRQSPQGAAISTGEPVEHSLDLVSEGVGAPHHVADDVIAAAWLERLPAGEEADPSSASGPPKTIVAASADGPIVELDTATGKVIRTIARRDRQTNLRLEGIVLSPDGKYVFFEQAVADPQRGCTIDDPAAGQIMRVARSGGEPEPVVTGRWPAISPDGRSLAFISYERCSTPGRLAVIAAENGEDAQLWEAPSGYSVDGTIGWDAGGTSVGVKYGRTDAKKWAVGYVDTTSDQRGLDVAELDFHPYSGVLHRTGARTRHVANYAPARDPGTYGFTEGDGTDVILGTGFVGFGVGELLAWTSDAAVRDCLYIVEGTGEPRTQLWWRSCRGNDDPVELPGSFTAAAW
jgi:Tol biopolymer transport system component